MSEAPKLYVHKPKKAQLKQFKRGMEGQSSSTPSSSSSTASATMSSKPPDVPKEPFLRRYRFLVPLVLGVNLAVGAYLFMRTKKKEVAIEDETSDGAPSTQAAASAAVPSSSVPPESPTAAVAVPIIAQPVVVPVEPIPPH